MQNFKLSKLAAIMIGLGVSAVLLVVGLMVVSRVFLRAGDEEPRDVVIAETTQNTAKITWTTQSDTQGVIEYGTSQTALNFFAPETKLAQNHTVELTLLSPGSTYYFQIRIGEKKYDNNGIPWTFTTKTTGGQDLTSPSPTSSKPTPTPVSSVVIPDANESPPAPSCNETDCVTICKKMGNGCGTSDFVKNNCVGKVERSTCTETASASATPTP